MSNSQSLVVFFNSKAINDDNAGRVWVTEIDHPEGRSAQECAADILRFAEGDEDTVVILDPKTFAVYASTHEEPTF